MALLQVEDHVINLKLLLNAYVEQHESYPAKFGIRYFVDAAAGPQEDENGNQGSLIEFSSKKKALEGLAKIASATDTLIIDDEDD